MIFQHVVALLLRPDPMTKQACCSLKARKGALRAKSSLQKKQTRQMIEKIGVEGGPVRVDDEGERGANIFGVCSFDTIDGK